MGGLNNNPSAWQFAAAYTKILTHCEVQEVTGVNSMALECVPILTASSHYIQASNMNAPTSSVINCSLNKSRTLENDAPNENEEINVLSEVDDESLCSSSVLSPHSDQLLCI